ncbi:MAG: hypothetical protein KKC05_00235, partial [Nanoarchaeota archaeon]|nr:hypothetical protein [Nanoarchaeota archaeon]
MRVAHFLLVSILALFLLSTIAGAEVHVVSEDSPKGIFVKGIIPKITSLEPETQKEVIKNYNTVQSPNAAPSCGDTITSDTVLTADLLGCAGNGLIIGADNVELDCDGHVIGGLGSGYGVSAYSEDNIIIRDCEVIDFNDGIYFSSSDDND